MHVLISLVGVIIDTLAKLINFFFFFFWGFWSDE